MSCSPLGRSVRMDAKLDQTPKHPRRISRRTLLRLGLYGVPALLAADAFLVEPRWFKVSRIDLSAGDRDRLSVVHLSDIHYRRNRRRLESVVARVNALAPDLVCITGDTVDHRPYQTEALEILSGLGAPVFGTPGNHEYWCNASLADMDDCFKSTGGGLLVNHRVAFNDTLEIVGVDDMMAGAPRVPAPAAAARPPRSILLTHCGDFVDTLNAAETFDLILSGHSHGGQVRIPFVGAPMLPAYAQKYDKGLYRTPAGPLYANVGLGTIPPHARFLCRPEIAVISLPMGSERH